MNGNVIQTSSIFSLKVLDGHVRVQEVTAITYPASHHGHLSLEELQMLLICKQETSIFVKLSHKMQILEYRNFCLRHTEKIQLSSVQAKIRG